MYPWMAGCIFMTLIWSFAGWYTSDKGPCQHYAVARTVYCTAYDVTSKCIHFEATPHEKMTCVDDTWSWWSYEGDK